MFQRLVAIPQDEYLSMSSIQNVQQPLNREFKKLDSQHQEEENIGDPYKRLVHQSSTLEQMKRLKEQMRQQLSITTPKPYRNRAQSLYNSIESFLKFNDRGELLDDNDRAIPHSRVEDLVQHAVRDRRRILLPTGWPHFLKVLREHNVPKSSLNRDTLNEMEKAQLAIKKEVTTPIKQRSSEKPSKQSIKRHVKQSLRKQPKRLTKPDFLKFY